MENPGTNNKNLIITQEPIRRRTKRYILKMSWAFSILIKNKQYYQIEQKRLT